MLNILASFLLANFAGIPCSQVAIFPQDGKAIISENCIEIEHSENKVTTILKMRLDLECSCPMFNKHTICKNFTQQG